MDIIDFKSRAKKPVENSEENDRLNLAAWLAEIANKDGEQKLDGAIVLMWGPKSGDVEIFNFGAEATDFLWYGEILKQKAFEMAEEESEE